MTMRNNACLAILGVTIFQIATLTTTADEPVPLRLSLRPQMLTLSPTATIEFTCQLTNTSDKPISVDWDAPWVTMFPRQINVTMSDGSMSKKVELAAGESQALPAVIRLGEDLPALDEGDYDLVFNISMDAGENRRHLRESLPIKIVARDGDKPVTTADSLGAAAHEYAKKMGGGDKIDLESYLIRRHGKGWSVELSLRGPKRFGTTTVSFDASGKRIPTLPIP
jgi:hypothetical protein